MKDEVVLYKTETLCPYCLKKLSGNIIKRNEEIYLFRICPIHGCYSHLISRHPAYYKQLRDYYFSIIKENFRQSRYLLFITEKCNLNCPICFYGFSRAGELTPFEAEDIMETNRGKEMVIFGREPTCNERLADIAKILQRFQGSTSLYTNGIKLNQIDYLRKLKKNGVSKIYLQFDGFRKEIYDEFRNHDELDKKLIALENLRRERVNTVLNITIVKNKNEDQIKPIIEYAVRNSFVKTLNFISYVRSGRGRKFLSSNSIMPDELIDIIERDTDNYISRKKIYLFQKFLYAYMSFLKRRTCFYVQYFWIYRAKDNGYIPIDKLINLEGMEKVLDRYKDLMRKNTFLARLYLLLFLPKYIVNYKSLGLVSEFLNIVFSHIFKIDEYSNKSSRFIQLIFTTACDPYKADSEISKRCHIGFIYKDTNGKIRRFDKNSDYLLTEESHAVLNESQE